MLDSSLSKGLASFASPFSQDTRILALRFASDTGLSDERLLAHRIKGHESLSQCYRYLLDCLSSDAYIELKALLGQPTEVALLLPEGGTPHLCGIVTGSECLGSDGGFTTFRLSIEPALATLAKRYNSRVYQDKSVPEIVADLLGEHLASNPAFVRSFQHQSHLSRDYPKRSYCIQYRESDLAFVERLLAEEGISYRFTHGLNTTSSIRANSNAGTSPSTPVHTLILFDSGTPHPQGSTGKVRFHRTDGVESEDTIDTWESSRSLQASQSSLVTYDYKQPTPYAYTQDTWTDSGGNGDELASTLEDYDPQTLYYSADAFELERYTTLRQQARDFASKTFRGQGTVRSLEVGTWFELQDHPVQDYDPIEEKQFLVIGLDFEACNNLIGNDTPVPGSRLGNSATTCQNQPPYRNSFTTVRRHIPVVPEYRASRHQKPTAPGRTTATVVGPAGEEIHTDELGRIKIQFHWQRKADHPNGGADFDERSSTWVRVAYPSAGAQWGSQFIPRVGQEVVVDFLEGDIDRPLVGGVVYNGTHLPPYFSGAGKLPGNRILSGVKTKEYQGNRYNELLFDDTTNQLRTKFSSEHAKTQLNQGFLIHPRADGKAKPRGEGLEARTDAYAALRGARGILISANAREAAANDHMDSRELSCQLAHNLELANNLSQASIDHHSAPLDVNTVAEHLLAITKSSYQQAGTEVAGYSEPILAFSAPAGITAATPKSQQFAAGEHLHISSGRDTNLAVGNRLVMSIKEAWSVFVALSGIKLFAGKGKVEIQAQDDNIEATARKDVRISSVDGHVVVTARESIACYLGGAMFRMQDGNIDFWCPGNFTVKAAQKRFEGPAIANNPLPLLPKGDTELPTDEFQFSNS